MIKKRFGQKIRSLRKADELTQEKLAIRCGLATRYIQEIESGSKQPTITTIFLLADGLNQSIDSLLEDVFQEWKKKGRPVSKKPVNSKKTTKNSIESRL